MSNQSSRRPLSARTEPTEIPNIPHIGTKNQILQFDHPDASPYVFTAILNSQNCISARRINSKGKTSNPSLSHKISPQASIPSFKSKSQSFKINENTSANANANEIYNKYSINTFATKSYRKPKRMTPTFQNRNDFLDEKLPNEKELLMIKKELEAMKPPAIIWNDTTNIPMHICVTESCETQKTENQGRKNSLDKKKQVGFIGPSQTILNGNIIVDNEPININQKPEAAPLISSKAFCQDYFGVLNSLSNMH